MSIVDTISPLLRHACEDMLDVGPGPYSWGLCSLKDRAFPEGVIECCRERRALEEAIAMAFDSPRGCWARAPEEFRSVYALKNLVFDLAPKLHAGGLASLNKWPQCVYHTAVLRWYRWALRVCQHADRIMGEADEPAL